MKNTLAPVLCVLAILSPPIAFGYLTAPISLQSAVERSPLILRVTIVETQNVFKDRALGLRMARCKIVTEIRNASESPEGPLILDEEVVVASPNIPMAPKLEKGTDYILFVRFDGPVPFLASHQYCFKIDNGHVRRPPPHADLTGQSKRQVDLFSEPQLADPTRVPVERFLEAVNGLVWKAEGQSE